MKSIVTLALLASMFGSLALVADTGTRQGSIVISPETLLQKVFGPGDCGVPRLVISDASLLRYQEELPLDAPGDNCQWRARLLEAAAAGDHRLPATVKAEILEVYPIAYEPTAPEQRCWVTVTVSISPKETVQFRDQTYFGECEK